MRTAAAGLLSLLILLSLPLGHAGTPANPELAKRLRDLGRRAQEYDRAVRGVIYPCPRCKGRGELLAGQQRLRCPSCSGSGSIASKALFKKLSSELRSPAYRAVAGRADIVARQYEEMLRTQQLPFEYGVIVGTELWDERHGVVTLQRSGPPGASQSPAPPPGIVRWVLAPEAGAERWFLWDQEADGPWPSVRLDVRMADEEKPAPEPAPSALPALEKALEGAALRHGVARARKEDLALVIELSRAPAAPSGDPLEAREADLEALVKVVRTTAAMPTGWERLRVRFLGRYKDAFGLIAERAFETAEATRAVVERMVPGSLSRKELRALFTIREEQYEGFRRLPDLDPAAVEVSESGLPNEAAQSLDRALAAANLAHARSRFALDEGTLVVALADIEEDAGEAAMQGDARSVVGAVRQALSDVKSWRKLRVLFLERWKHRLGRIEERPSIAIELDREVADRLVLENLDPGEVWALFSVTQPVHEGWKRVQGP